MINITKVFDGVEQRSVPYLESVYQNDQLLYDKIKSVLALNVFDKSVLVKPNWVLHSQRKEDKYCLITNHKFLLQTLRVLLDQKPKRIMVGDAPIQGCDWEALHPPIFYAEINKLKNKYSIPIEMLDFRRTRFDLKHNQLVENYHPIENYTIFDLGIESALEPISGSNTNFRVTDYDPRKLKAVHDVGIHKYCITNTLFESDVVITIPKIKTHQKTGITNAMKILVGINGDKDYLPHHRLGGADMGGDCYPKSNIFLRVSEKLLDVANKYRGTLYSKSLKRLAIKLWRLTENSPYFNHAAAWYGNDTTWRMVQDLNKIAIYGNSDGTLSRKAVRTVYSLCDGIIAGQGDGPLKPDPLPLGLICFSDNSVAMDYAVSLLFQFDVEKIPLIANSIKECDLNNEIIHIDENPKALSDIEIMGIKTTPPPGWVGHVEKNI